MQLNETQRSQIHTQIQRLVKTDSYYGKIYRELGIQGIQSQEDFEALPFSSKDDLRNAYPLGIQAVPDEEVVRIHSSSGTTGRPVIIACGQQASVSRQAVRSLAPWQFRWGPATRTNNFK